MGWMKWLLLGVLLITYSTYDVSADVIPSENECRPYIEKAIHELKNPETTDNKESTEDNTTIEQDTSIEKAAENSLEQGDEEVKSQEENVENTQDDQTSNEKTEEGDSKEDTTAEDKSQEQQVDDDNKSQEQQVDDGIESQEINDDKNESLEAPATDDGDNSKEETGELENDSKEGNDDSSKETQNDGDDTQEQNSAQVDGESEQAPENASNEQEQPQQNESAEDNTAAEVLDEKSLENDTEDGNDSQQTGESVEEEKVRAKRSLSDDATQEQEDSAQDGNESQENVEANDESSAEANENSSAQESSKEASDNNSQETNEASQEVETQAEPDEPSAEDNANASQETAETSQESDTVQKEIIDDQSGETTENNSQEASEVDTSQENDSQQEKSSEDDQQSEETMPEEELTLEFEIPKNLRARDHIGALLGLDAESSIKENALKRTGDVILKDLKKIYDNAVKPLETMYKYRDLSNRHFGDPEMFSKPLVLFMGPWSGGKSTILNYLTENEYTPNSIRSGAEPSPAHFNILMYGDEPEVLDGTQLAADWTFSGLQKFGEGLMDRLRGQRLPNKLLERVNIVEIPGILEVRKHVSRYFPFNDACQWFIDRADIIFLVYDPSKLDVGPETEAILDQLKGREYQTRILLNKADQVKPEELLRVQGALIWNISPLMSSQQPPVMYTVSLWSHPFEAGSPIRLLQAQEKAFLIDLREAIDRRIENKIASARRFAVRIRNHAKMVDCYLTTYYNQKGLFSNKKQIADKIIEHPQNYNIYEGLSTLTNISRYDLPDPEVYLDFFRLNPLFEFKKLSETCTYFKGCPINKLDIAIAYELPELVGKYKNLFVENLKQLRKEFDENCNNTEPEPPVKINKSR